MILVAVGTQFPFDRMVRVVDAWAMERGRDDVIGQIGPSDYQPQAIKCFRMIEPGAFATMQREADVIVAHAGMGSILGAIEAGTPIVIMPRLHAMGEHRNDHQLATAKQFGETGGVYVATDEAALRGYLDRLDTLEPAARADGGASETLITALRGFVADTPRWSWRRLFRFGARTSVP